MWNYDKISPITGNKSVVCEYDDLHGESQLCLESGYHTDELIQENIEDYTSKLPQIIKDSVFIEPSGKQWFKTMLFSKDSILVPVADGWEVNTYRDLNIDEPNRFDVFRVQKNVAGSEYEQVLDPSNATHFFDFIDALNEFTKRSNNEN